MYLCKWWFTTYHPRKQLRFNYGYENNCMRIRGQIKSSAVTVKRCLYTTTGDRSVRAVISLSTNSFDFRGWNWQNLTSPFINYKLLQRVKTETELASRVRFLFLFKCLRSRWIKKGYIHRSRSFKCHFVSHVPIGDHWSYEVAFISN